MLATVVVVCPSGSSESASMPTAILIDVGAAACPPQGTPTRARPTTHTRARTIDGLAYLRLIVLPPLFPPVQPRRPFLTRRPAGVSRVTVFTLSCRHIPLLPGRRPSGAPSQPPRAGPGRGAGAAPP